RPYGKKIGFRKILDVSLMDESRIQIEKNTQLNRYRNPIQSAVSKWFFSKYSQIKHRENPWIIVDSPDFS
ncbi:MAG: hypothetical protein ACI3W5_09940, partial [Faecousia sp.]